MFRTRNQLLHGSLGSGKQGVRQGEELEYLYDDLHCHPYKMAIVQELSKREGRVPHFDVSLPFVKGFSVFQSTGSTLDVSLPFVKGFSVLQSTGFTLDVSLPFVKGFFLSSSLRVSHWMVHYLS